MPPSVQRTTFPQKFKPHTPQLEKSLKRANDTHIWTISTTFQDWNKLKFAWLATRKDSLNNIEEHLIAGDIILYHNRKSKLGWLIRHFTKNYWEHAAPYVGGGEVIDIAPGGCRRTSLKNGHVIQTLKLQSSETMTYMSICWKQPREGGTITSA